MDEKPLSSSIPSSPPVLASIKHMSMFPSLVPDQPLPQGVICKCSALYSYTADVNDAKEIGFSKGDVFQVHDNGGKWWKVKKENDSGEVSDDFHIVPSNCNFYNHSQLISLDMKVI